MVHFFRHRFTFTPRSSADVLVDTILRWSADIALNSSRKMLASFGHFRRCPSLHDSSTIIFSYLFFVLYFFTVCQHKLMHLIRKIGGRFARVYHLFTGIRYRVIAELNDALTWWVGRLGNVLGHHEKEIVLVSVGLGFSWT